MNFSIFGKMIIFYNFSIFYLKLVFFDSLNFGQIRALKQFLTVFVVNFAVISIRLKLFSVFFVFDRILIKLLCFKNI